MNEQHYASVRDWLNGRALPFTVTPEILDVMEEMWKLGAEAALREHGVMD